MKSIRTQDEGVSKVRKKITALTVVFSLIIAMFAGGLQTFAAGADDISITGLVSDSATAQKFRIDNQTNRQIEVQWQTEEYNTGWTPVTIAANGSAVVNCADPDMTGVTTPFTDLTSDWYQAAVAWAYETGVVDGTSPTTFSPSRPVTREQAAVLLMRYAARLPGFAGSDAPADLSAFADGGSVSGWARAGMADAVALGLFGGSQDSSGQVWLRPGAGTTRAETAALLQRMCTKVLGIG